MHSLHWVGSGRVGMQEKGSGAGATAGPRVGAGLGDGGASEGSGFW